MSAHAGQERSLLQILVFGGTSEGRELVEWLSARATCAVIVSALTEYGGLLVEGLPRVEPITGALSAEAMKRLMHTRNVACVIDATHPYAVQVSAEIEASARACGIPRYRVLREGEPVGPWKGFDTALAAAEYAAAFPGNVLLTTGSKDLTTYVAAMPDYRERLYARILPVPSSIAVVDGLGIPASHTIAMQGPFSREMNEAMLREFDIGLLVTKASGVAGGFWEKVDAAQACGVELAVIHRPRNEEGMSLAEVKMALAQDWSV